MRLATIATLLAGAALAGIPLVAGADTDSPRPTATRTGGAAGLLGISPGKRQVGLVRVDPQTLRPAPGGGLPLGIHTFAWSFAPGRTRIALGSYSRPSVRLVDLRRNRVLGDVRLAARGEVWATAWSGSRRLLALVLRPGCACAGETRVSGIATTDRRVLWRRTLSGVFSGGARAGGRLVLLVAPRDSIGPSRLALVEPDGRVRWATLPEIQSGSQVVRDDDPAPDRARSWIPGLAVDSSGTRAFVAQAGAPVAEVDLDTLEVHSHPLSEAGAADNPAEGPTRRLLWLGRDLMAMTGTDAHAGRETAAGLKLIDTRRWSIRTLADRPSEVALVGPTLLASTFLWDSRRGQPSGSGLTGYALDGTRRFHLYGTQPLFGVQPLGDRALVAGKALSAIVDARNGRELRRVRPRGDLLVGDQAFSF